MEGYNLCALFLHENGETENAMPGWAKALIIVAILAVLLVVGVIAAGAYWWSHNKDALIARGKAQMEEGRDAGRTTDNQGCVDQSVLRYKADLPQPEKKISSFLLS